MGIFVGVIVAIVLAVVALAIAVRQANKNRLNKSIDADVQSFEATHAQFKTLWKALGYQVTVVKSGKQTTVTATATSSTPPALPQVVTHTV